MKIVAVAPPVNSYGFEFNALVSYAYFKLALHTDHRFIKTETCLVDSNKSDTAKRSRHTEGGEFHRS